MVPIWGSMVPNWGSIGPETQNNQIVPKMPKNVKNAKNIAKNALTN